MASNKNTFNLLSGNKAKALYYVAIARASASMQNPDVDSLCHYPMFWIYAAVTGKTWEQIRDDAGERFRRSLTTREMDRFLAATDNVLYRSILERFSMHLWCKWTKAGSPRSHRWTAAQLAVVCPENSDAIRKTDFQEQLDAEIAYLDFDPQSA